ncbi:MAG: NADPH-dependent F420 reductase [Acidobacteriia bacterium]|nr:NADPH-dependent F420 reductase [Terriglobia bacterium]
MHIGFLGGTGIEAKGLALRFAAAGASVIVGSRSAERAAQAAERYNTILGESLIRGAGNHAMLDASEIIFLTVPFAQAVNAVENCGTLLTSRHVIVDVTVPLLFRAGHAEYLEPENGSNSEQIARHLPAGVPLVAAFKTIPAFVLADLETTLNCDVFVCSDSADAKQKVMAAANLIPSLRPLDGGPLRTARTLERMTTLAAELNRHYKKKGARYRIEGI